MTVPRTSCTHRTAYKKNITTLLQSCDTIGTLPVSLIDLQSSRLSLLVNSQCLCLFFVMFPIGGVVFCRIPQTRTHRSLASSCGNLLATAPMPMMVYPLSESSLVLATGIHHRDYFSVYFCVVFFFHALIKARVGWT